MNKRKIGFLSTLSVILVVIGVAILFSTDIILSINKLNNTSPNNTTEQSTNVNKNNTLVIDSSLEEVSLDGYLFLGDSYTVLLQETIEKNNPDAIVLGQIGVQPGYWNENFDVLPDDNDVNGVVLLIGVNGVTFDDNLPNKKKLIDSLVKKYEGKTIYVQKVFPVGKNFTNANPDTFNESIKSHNEEIQSYCEKYDNVIFIDATKDLVTEDGYLKYTKDGLHIRSDKQETFYSNIEDAVNNIN